MSHSLTERRQPETAAQPVGQYRRYETVTTRGSLVVSRQPLSALRLNDAGIRIVETLETTSFQTPTAVADAVRMDREAVATLLDRLHRRGLVEWRPDRDESFQPPVSVVVTVRDAADVLNTCLDALTALSYPSYEVILVDDGSTDGTRDLARTHRLSEAGALRVVSVGSAGEPLGIGASRNRGVEEAAHDVVAFTDADCRPRRDWLTTLVPCLAAHDVVGGRIRPHGTSTTDTYEGINSSLDMGAYGGRVDPDGSTPYLPTANLLGRRAVFESVPFQERNVAEDVEFCWQALADGFDVVYEPAGVVEHDYRQATGEFAGRRATYAASEGLLATRFTNGQRVPVSLGSSVAVVALLLGVVGVLGGLVTGTSDRMTTGTALVPVGLLVGGIGWLSTAVLVRIWQSYRRLRCVVSVEDVLSSAGRTLLSSGYAVSRELTRYYSIPLTLLGLAAVGVGGATGSAVALAGGSVVLSLVVATVALPLVVEYVVHEPDVSLAAYGWWYLWDHLGYQTGAIRGAVAYGTMAHLRPWKRLRLVGWLPRTLTAVGTRLRDTETSPVRRVTVGDHGAEFVVESSAESWWFDDGNLGGERPVLREFLDTLDADDVVLDVGANVGLYSSFAAEVVGGENVLAVEPHPANADRLGENLALNGHATQCHRVALTDDPDAKTVALRTAGERAGTGEHALVPPRDGHDPAAASTTVGATTGDELVATHEIGQPTVVKIDVEGAEGLVLRGLSSVLSDPACRRIYCEVHPDTVGSFGDSPAGIEQTLREYGFAVTRLGLDTDDERYVRRGEKVPKEDGESRETTPGP